jgi:LacI family transcriptional regulator
MAITLHDICRETGLSTATVSRVLNNSPLVKKATHDRVREVMDRLDYHPSPAARALAGQRTYTLAVLSPYVGGGFFADVLVGADHVAVEQGYHILTAFAHGLTDEKDLVTGFIRDRRADALIVLNLDLPAEFLAEVHTAKTPVISVDTPAAELGVPSVSIDNKAGAHQLMTHILEHDHRDIIIFTGPAISYDSNERLAGCRAAAEDAGCKLPPSQIIVGEFTIESGRKLMTELLDRGGKLPDAIVALNDAMAIGALGVMKERGLTAPEDIAVTGFDDCDSAPVIGLTTVHAPLYQMGQEAAKLALASLTPEGPAANHIIVPTELVIRQSCGCQP